MDTFQEHLSCRKTSKCIYLTQKKLPREVIIMELHQIKVIKRKGTSCFFDASKIQRAIQKAFLDVPDNPYTALQINEFSTKTTDKVVDEILKRNKDTIHIEDIQEIVENKLMCSSRKDVAKSYIRFRHLRAEERNKIENLDKRIGEIVDMQGDKVNENANKDANVWPTKRDLVAGVVAKDYAWRHILPKNITKAHDLGQLHWHDADYSPMFSMFNCMLINFKGMLEDGFCIGNADIEPPKGINTATALVAQIVANVSSNIYGGTSFNRVDEVLEPYAKLTEEKHKQVAEQFIKNGNKETEERLRKEYVEERTRKSIYDAMQSLEYELNTLYNSNGGLQSLAA